LLLTLAVAIKMEFFIIIIIFYHVITVTSTKYFFLNIVFEHLIIESYKENINPILFYSGGVHVSASRGSPPVGSSVGGQAGMGSGLNCGQGSPGTTSGTGGSGSGGTGGGGVSCVADVSTNEGSDWRGAHSIAALRRRASDASQQYSPQPPPPGPPQYTHDMEYSPVYQGVV